MKLKVHGASEVGLVRERNEDAFFVDESRGVFAVADGVGGMPGGALASQTAVEALRQALADLGTAPPDLAALVQRVHEEVRKAGRAYGRAGIATTLTLAHVEGARVRVAHVGDSFALLVRDGRCRALTREHNLENERTDIESLAPFPPSYRYALTRVVGQLEPLTPDLVEETLEAGDWLVLATDGLTDLVEPPEIARTCLSAADVRAAGARLTRLALERGGHDNITVVVIRVEAD